MIASNQALGILEVTGFTPAMVALDAMEKAADVSVLQAVATYAAAQLVGGLPGMPGGLGVTEGALALILASYGFPASTTLAPIIVYRVVSYWLPAGLSFLAGGSTFLKSPEAKAVADSN